MPNQVCAPFIAIPLLLAFTLMPSTATAQTPRVFVEVDPFSVGNTHLTLANITANFTHHVALAMSITDSRITLLSAFSVPQSPNVTNITFVFNARTAAEELAGAPTPLQLTVTFSNLLRNQGTGVTGPLYTQYLEQFHIVWFAIEEYTLMTTSTAAPETTQNITVTPVPTPAPPTYTPAPTVDVPQNGTLPEVGTEEESGSLIYAIVFGILGTLCVIGGVTFCVKTFVMRKKTDHSKRGGGYKYATKHP